MKIIYIQWMHKCTVTKVQNNTYYNRLSLFLDRLVPTPSWLDSLLVGLLRILLLQSLLLVCALPRQDGQKEYEQEQHSAWTKLYSLAGDEQLGHFVCFVCGMDSGTIFCDDKIFELREVSGSLSVCFLWALLATWFSFCFCFSFSSVLTGSLLAMDFRLVQNSFQRELTAAHFWRSAAER